MRKAGYWVLLMVLVACSKFSVDTWFGHDGTESQGSGTRYLDDVFENVGMISNVQYGRAYNWVKSQWEDLYLDAYYPVGDQDSSRWSILFVHGGNFNGGDKASPSSVSFCESVARKGYVVFSINYRLQITRADSLNFLDGYQMAGSDTRTAIGFVDSIASIYRLDSNRIVAFGSSAGGFAVLGATYDAALDSASTNGRAPNLAAESAGALPDTNLIQTGEPALYIQHCQYDKRIGVWHANNLVTRLSSTGIAYSTWLPTIERCAGDNYICHTIFKCRQKKTVSNLSAWIYQNFGD